VIAVHRTRIKICGLTREDDVLAAVNAGADAIGFVFYPPSPRYVSPARAAELARLHILSAVEHLLQHPPVQGKFALDRALSSIQSEYFPRKIADAVQVLSGGPLRRPKDSLVRSVVIVIIKQLIENQPYEFERRLITALSAIRELHFASYEATLKSKLSVLFRAINDDELDHAVLLLKQIPHAWDHLEQDVVTRLQQYVLNAPSKSLENVSYLESFSALSDFARQRIGRATRKELSENIFFELSAALGDRFIELYLKSDSFKQANDWAAELISYKSDFNEQQLTRLIEGVATNSQLMGSNRLNDVIRAFRAATVLSPRDYEKLLCDNGLVVYAHVNGESDKEDEDSK